MGTRDKGHPISNSQLARARADWPLPETLPNGRVRGAVINENTGEVVGWYEHAAGFDPFSTSDDEKTYNRDHSGIGSEGAGNPADVD